MPKKNAKHAAPTSGKKTTKAGFVRSLPDTMPAKDVVAQGAAAGLEFSEKYVYNTRSSARIKPARVSAPRAVVKAAPVARVAAPVTVSGGSSPAVASESAFRKLVLDLGIARSKSLLSDVESKLAALINGR